MYPDRKPKVIMALTCRYYENRYPEIDDVVMVNVRSIADMGAYVHLLEYNNIEGKTRESGTVRLSTIIKKFY